MSISVSDIKEYGCRKIFKYMISDNDLKELNKLNLVFKEEKVSPFILAGKLNGLVSLDDFFGFAIYRKVYSYDDTITAKKNFSKAYASFLKKCAKSAGLDAEEGKLFCDLGSLCPILSGKQVSGENIFENVSDLSIDILCENITNILRNFVSALNYMLAWQSLVDSNINIYHEYIDILICKDMHDFLEYIHSASCT